MITINTFNDGLEEEYNIVDFKETDWRTSIVRVTTIVRYKVMDVLKFSLKYKVKRIVKIDYTGAGFANPYTGDNRIDEHTNILGLTKFDYILKASNVY
jgi:hypothetical protein